jgi:hypothetical protein
MAHQMGIRVVMEGIEDEADAEACRAVGADLGQGWLFGRPVTWARAAELIAAEVQAPGLRAELPRQRRTEEPAAVETGARSGAHVGGHGPGQSPGQSPGQDVGEVAPGASRG